MRERARARVYTTLCTHRAETKTDKTTEMQRNTIDRNNKMMRT